MPVEVIGIDHIYIAVSNLKKSEEFYDGVMMTVLDFKKTYSNIENDPHVHYYNRHYSFTLRPSRNLEQKHDPYSPGLNHFCFRVDSNNDRAIKRRPAC